MGTAQSPVTLPNGTNVAPLGQALASSQSDAQPASAAIDGNIQGYPGNSSAEWSSAGETTTAWWGVLWPDTYNITSVALYDRPNQNGASSRSPLLRTVLTEGNGQTGLRVVP